jgi:hypothetical protein
MARAIAAVCGVVLIAGAATGSAGAASPREWVMSGSLTGTYSNSVTWINCTETGVTGTASERVSLHATLSHGSPAPYEGTGLFLAAQWRAGGTWSVTGSNPPRHEQPDDTVTCGAQQPFHCGGAVRGAGGNGDATLYFAPRGRTLSGHFARNDFFTEGTDPCPSIGSTLDGVGPLFGLGDTRMEPDAFLENSLKPGSLTIPRSRLDGRAPFSIRHTAGPDQGCPRREDYIHCTEAGRLTLTLRFKRAR